MRVVLPILLAVCLGATASGCKKEEVPVHLEWHTNVDRALVLSMETKKPFIVFFGATWDTAWKELEHVTLAHPEVRATLARDFVVAFVDESDDEDPAVQREKERFRIVGDPTVVVLHPDGVSEIVRFNEYVPPAKMIVALRKAAKSCAS